MTAKTSRSVDWPGTRPWPSKLEQAARKRTKNQPPARLRLASPLNRGANQEPLFTFAGLRGEVLLELVGLVLVGVGVGRRRALARDVGPLDSELRVHLEPLLRLAVRVGDDRIRRALGLAHPAIDALVRMDDQHVVALIEPLDGADLDAVHVFALDAVFGDDVGHRSGSESRRKRKFSGGGLSHVGYRRRGCASFVYMHNPRE